MWNQPDGGSWYGREPFETVFVVVHIVQANYAVIATISGATVVSSSIYVNILHLPPYTALRHFRKGTTLISIYYMSTHIHYIMTHTTTGLVVFQKKRTI